MKKCEGFTLIELGFTVVIVAIVTTLAIPSMTELFKSTRITNGVNEFVAALQLARSEAVKRGESVSINADGVDWEDGWLVVTAGGVTLKQFKQLHVDMTVTSVGGFTSFTYDATGRIDNADTLTWCDDRTAENGRLIAINATGRTSVDTFACP